MRRTDRSLHLARLMLLVPKLVGVSVEPPETCERVAEHRMGVETATSTRYSVASSNRSLACLWPHRRSSPECSAHEYMLRNEHLAKGSSSSGTSSATRRASARCLTYPNLRPSGKLPVHHANKLQWDRDRPADSSRSRSRSLASSSSNAPAQTTCPHSAFRTRRSSGATAAACVKSSSASSSRDPTCAAAPATIEGPIPTRRRQ